MRWCFTLTAGAALVLIAAGCGGSKPPPKPEVVKVFACPFGMGICGPGPGGWLGKRVAARKPVPGIPYVPLRKIEDEIPATLPKNPPQPCNQGALVKITLAGGQVVTYGPCKIPPAIERLRLKLVRAGSRSAGGLARFHCVGHPGSRLVRSADGRRVARLSKLIEIFGFENDKRARVSLPTVPLPKLYARRLSAFRGWVVVRGFSCATGLPIAFGLPPEELVAGARPAWRIVGRPSIPSKLEFLPWFRQPGTYYFIATRRGKAIGSLYIHATR